MRTSLLLIALLGAGLAPPAAARAAETGWLTYNKDYDSQRYSSLTEINRGNVSRLTPLCEAQLGDMGALQSGILVVGTRLYLATPRTTLALDATTCALLWRHVHNGATTSVVSPSNRGPGYADGRIYRGTAEGALLALDARTGAERWRIAGADPRQGEFFSSAPIAWKGRVYIGTSGGDVGGRARVMAYDVRDGHEVWRFNVIPSPGEAGADSWQLASGARPAGGAIWGSYSLDPRTGELYVVTGNPSPAMAPLARGGANLYTNSVVALDAATGALRWYLQLLPNDALDYDLVSAPMLYRDAHGAPRLAVAGKDGHLNLIDGRSHARVARVPVTTVFNQDKVPTVEGIRICPGIWGGVGWNGPAFDPTSTTVFVGAIDMCMQTYLHKGDLPRSEPSFGTIAFPSKDPVDAISGWVTAVDGTTGQVRWKYHAEGGVVAGITPTAGGIVFTGDAHGTLLALDSRDGTPLLKADTGGTMAGGVVTYSVAGKQYVAYAAGGVMRGNLVKAVIEPKVVIATLNAPPGGPRRVVLPSLDPTPPAATDAASAQARGGVLYGKLCATCHGPQGDGMTAPRLRGIDTRSDRRPVAEIIKDPKPGMARVFPGVADERDVADLVRFLEGLK